MLCWNIAKLSLVGRVVVGFHVAHLSVWLCSRSALPKVQRLNRNFLWESKDCSYVRAKVSWKVIAAPKDEGGLG